MKRVAAFFLLLLSFEGAAQAGPFTDEMARCLVRKTTEADKTLLIQWVYAAMSSHPDVASVATLDAGKGAEINQATANLLTDLLAVRCRNETRDAIKYEGDSAFSASFEVLGKVAMQGLMSHPSVSQYMSGMAKGMDEEKLKKALGTNK